MRDPRRTQQLQGLAGLLEGTGIPKTIERMAYGEPVTNAQMANVPLLRPETAEALLTLLPTAPFATKAAKATKGLPVGMSIKDVSQRSIYPQEEALRLAQQRAALPVERGGLGLPANNTPEMRAQAMGFDVPAYHGSGVSNIEAFDPRLAGSKTGNPFDNYVWMTSSPESASSYALNPEQFSLLPEVKTLNQKINDLSKAVAQAYDKKDFEKMGQLRSQISVIQKQKSELYKDFEQGKLISEESTVYPVVLKSGEFMPYEGGGKNWMSVNRKAIDESKDKGFQGVAIQNVKDNPNQTVGNIVANTFATENPELIRSRFAAFDPFRRTAAIAATMGVAAPDLLAAENPLTEEEIRYIRSLLD